MRALISSRARTSSCACFCTTTVYYRQFEVAISTAELEKWNATTHTELNKSYADGDNEYDTKMFQVMCLIIPADLDRYSGNWNDLNNITLLGTYNYPKNTTSTYDVLCRCKKPAPPRQLHAPPAAVTFSKVVIQRKIIQHQGIMVDPFQKLHAIVARRQDGMR